MLRPALIVVLLPLLLSGTACIQSVDTKSGAPAVVEVAVRAQDSSAPPPEMKALERLLGTWRVDNIGKVPEETRSTTTTKRELVLGGRFVHETGAFDDNGKPTYTCMYTYDPTKQTYRWWFFHAHAPEPCLESTGTWDESRQAFTFMNSPGGGGATVTSFHFPDETTLDWSMIVKDASGKVVFHMEAKAVRQKIVAETPASDGGSKPAGDMSPAEKTRLMKVVEGDLSVAKNDNERFYALNRAAKNALAAGKKADAKKYAEELEKLAPNFKNDWNYGNAIQDANHVLGRLALAEGNLKEAKRRLLASANSKGSPQMNSFGPNMSLAKELLAKGEKDVVLEYFALCGKFWISGAEKLKAWTAAVKEGETPDFGANLNY